MVTLTQKDVENRVARNSNRYKVIIEQVVSDIRLQGFKKNRCRPRNPSEALILNSFKKQ